MNGEKRMFTITLKREITKKPVQKQADSAARAVKMLGLVEGEYCDVSYPFKGGVYNDTFMMLDGEPWPIPHGPEPGSLHAMEVREKFRTALSVIRAEMA